MTLTPDGLTNYQDVVAAIFSYVNLLKESSLLELKSVFDEIRTLSELQFNYKEKISAAEYTRGLSFLMHSTLPRERLLSQMVFRRFDHQDIKEALNYLRPDNLRLMIVCQDCPSGWNKKTKWYDVDYTEEKISSIFAEKILKAAKGSFRDINSELHLPRKNPFIPSTLTVDTQAVMRPLKPPILLRHNQVQLWWKKDNTFRVPKAYCKIALKTPLVYETPVNLVLTYIFCNLVTDELKKDAYEASLTGLKSRVTTHYYGIHIAVSDFDATLPKLLAIILTNIRNLNVQREHFNIIKESLTRSYNSSDFRSPFDQIEDWLLWLTGAKAWNHQECAAELVRIRIEDVVAFCQQLFQESQLIFLVYGNISKERTLKIADMIVSTLGGQALSQPRWDMRRDLDLPPGCDYIYPLTHPDPANSNHCLEYFLYVGDQKKCDFMRSTADVQSNKS